MTIHEQIERAKQALGKVQNEHSLTAAKEAESALVSLLLSEESSFMLRLQLDAASNALVEAQTENDMQQCYIDSLAQEVHKMREHAKQFAEKYAIESDTSYYETVERTVRGFEESLRRMESRVGVLQAQLHDSRHSITARDSALKKILFRASELNLQKDALQDRVEKLELQYAMAQKEVDMLEGHNKHLSVLAHKAVAERDNAQCQVTELKAKCNQLEKLIGGSIWKECKYFSTLPLIGEPVIVALHELKDKNGNPTFHHVRLVAGGPNSWGFRWMFSDGREEMMDLRDLWCPSPWVCR